MIFVRYRKLADPGNAGRCVYVFSQAQQRMEKTQMHTANAGILGFMALTLIVSGCATLTRGTEEVLVIETRPAGAQARLSTGETCTTPCALQKKRKESFMVHIHKDGYEPIEIQVTNQVAGSGAAGMAGNVIFGGIIGAAVDAGTGATRELVPNPVSIDLEPLGTPDGKVGE